MNSGGALVHVRIAWGRLRVGHALGEALVTHALVAGHSVLRTRNVEAHTVAADFMIGSIAVVVELNCAANTLVIGRTDAVESAKRIQASASILTAQFGSWRSNK